MQAKYRLKNNASFSYIYKNGRRYYNKYIILFVSDTKYGLKAGFSVGKKVGKSVARNRVKRKMREAFRLIIPQLARNNYVLIANPPVAELSYREISSCILSLLEKAGALRR